MSAVVLGILVLVALFVVFGFVPFAIGNGDYFLGVAIICFIAIFLIIAWTIGTVTMEIFELI